MKASYDHIIEKRDEVDQLLNDFRERHKLIIDMYLDLLYEKMRLTNLANKIFLKSKKQNYDEPKRQIQSAQWSD